MRLATPEQTKTTSSAASNFFIQKKKPASHDFSKISSHIIQSKLTIGSSDDVYEKEADVMADKVMRTPLPGTLSFSSEKIVSRKCAECEEEEKLQRKESGSGSTETVPPIVHDVLNSSGGRSMDSETRSFMESRFNYDFSDVKIHDSDLAAKSANSIHALAYTSGNNIVFNHDQYSPATASGKKLLAHELTHIVQQTGLQRSPLDNQKIQRQQADELNLTSPRFAGDPLLERVFDDEDVISKNRNRRGEPVKKIQQALIDAGFPLPKFGADGIFGDETEKAVRAFQKASGLNQQQQDGIVGENTLSRLDSRFPTTNAPGTPVICETPKQVPVDVIILNGVQRNVQPDFDFLNKTYGPCCLKFVQNSTIQLGLLETVAILGFDGLLDVANCGDITLNETALALSMSLRSLSGRVKLVYVNKMSPSRRGLSVSPKCGTGPRNALTNTAMVEAAADARTPAHEIGHILLNVFADHAVVAGNIMHVTPGSTGSDVATVQCDIIFART